MTRMPPPELTSPIVGPRSPFSSHWLNPQFPLKRESGFRDNNAQGEKSNLRNQRFQNLKKLLTVVLNFLCSNFG